MAVVYDAGDGCLHVGGVGAVGHVAPREELGDPLNVV